MEGSSHQAPLLATRIKKRTENKMKRTYAINGKHTLWATLLTNNFRIGIPFTVVGSIPSSVIRSAPSNKNWRELMCGCIYIYGRGHVTGRYQEYIYVMYQTYNKEYIYIYKKKILPYSVSMRIRFKASQKNSILSMFSKVVWRSSYMSQSNSKDNDNLRPCIERE